MSKFPFESSEQISEEDIQHFSTEIDDSEETQEPPEFIPQPRSPPVGGP